VYTVMREARADVVVYVARQFTPWRRVLVPFTGSIHDGGALEIAQRIAANNDTRVTLLHVIEPRRHNGAPQPNPPTNATISESERVHLHVVESDDPLETVVREAQQDYDLVLIGVSATWGLEPTPFSPHHERLARECPASLLIVRKYQAAT